MEEKKTQRIEDVTMRYIKRRIISGATLFVIALGVIGCGASSEAQTSEGISEDEAQTSNAGNTSKTAQTSTAESADSQNVQINEATKDVFAMDTYMTLTAYGEQAQVAVDAAATEIARLDALLSTGSDSSEVTKLNQNQGGELSEDTLELVTRALEVYESTEGAFDMTIYPLMQLWGFTDQNYHVPSEQELVDTLPLVNSGKLQIAGDQLTMPEPGMEIDLGGIAKGYTSTKVMEIFRSYNITSAVISLGGNVQVLGNKTDGSAWRVAITDPDNETSYLGVLQVTDQAVITSGGYERYFEENGQSYHHILDPATGYPADNGLLSVTIVSADGTLADALSTSLYVMGKDKAIAYCEAHMEEDGFGAILYTTDGELCISDNLSEAFTAEGSQTSGEENAGITVFGK